MLVGAVGLDHPSTASASRRAASGCRRRRAACAPPFPGPPGSASRAGQARGQSTRRRSRSCGIEPGGAGDIERARVGGLVIVDGVRIRDQNGGPADGGQFTHRGRSRPGDHQMGAGEAVRNIVEERAEVRRHAQSLVGGADAIQVLGAALLADREPASRGLRHPFDGRRNHVAEHPGALAAAEHEKADGAAAFDAGIGPPARGSRRPAGPASRCERSFRRRRPAGRRPRRTPWPRARPARRAAGWRGRGWRSARGSAWARRSWRRRAWSERTRSRRSRRRPVAPSVSEANGPGRTRARVRSRPGDARSGCGRPCARSARTAFPRRRALRRRRRRAGR